MSTANFERAIGVTRSVLSNVTPAQMGEPTPCASWTVRDLVNHIIGEHYFFAGSVLQGSAPAMEGDAPDFTGGDLIAAFDEATKQSVVAFAEPGAMENESRCHAVKPKRLVIMNRRKSLMHRCW